MGLRKGQGIVARGAQALRIQHRLTRGHHAARQCWYALGGTRCVGKRGGLGKVEGVRPHDHRAAAGGRFNQILATEFLETAAQQRRIRQAVVKRHLAHGVTQPDVEQRSTCRLMRTV